MPLRKLHAYEQDTQFIMVLLAALVDLSDRIPTKREVETHIEKRGYLKLSPELLQKAYASKSEAKWKTLLAFAREHSRERDYLKRLSKRNAWEITEKGRKFVASVEQRFREGKFEVQRFEFFSANFLERMSATA